VWEGDLITTDVHKRETDPDPTPGLEGTRAQKPSFGPALVTTVTGDVEACTVRRDHAAGCRVREAVSLAICAGSTG